MGLNEFAGYFSVGIIAFLSGFIANKYGITPYSFYIGIVIAITAFLLTLFWVKDTRAFVNKERATDNTNLLNNVFLETTFKNKALSAVTQTGLINNLNDGMIWGLLPILLVSFHFNNENIGIIATIYPTVWGIGQLFTGKMSDHYSKKSMSFWGILLQGIAILLIPFSSSFIILACISAVLGLGTALVYPTFLSTIAQATNPTQRTESIGAFRLWRDLSYAFGAVISGITADLFGVSYAIFIIGALTIISSIIIKLRMPEKHSIVKECIEVDEVKKAILSDTKIQLIDLRNKEKFEQLHISNAINIDVSELKNNISKFNKTSKQITVCGKEGGHSSEGTKLLKEMGYNAIWLCGGATKCLQSIQ